MRRIFPLLAWLLISSAAGGAESPREIGAFRVHHRWPPSVDALAASGNTAIHIGSGYFLTASHVSQPPHAGDAVGLGIDGAFHPATIIRAGTYDSVDVTLLRIDPADLPRRLREAPALALCGSPLAPGTQAWVVSAGSDTQARILGLADLPPGIPDRYASLITNMAGSGQSGSGVLPPSRDCLAGIVSRVVSQTTTRADGSSTSIVLAKYFVPAEEIGRFLSDSLPRPNRPPFQP